MVTPSLAEITSVWGGGQRTSPLRQYSFSSFLHCFDFSLFAVCLYHHTLLCRERRQGINLSTCIPIENVGFSWKPPRNSSKVLLEVIQF